MSQRLPFDYSRVNSRNMIDVRRDLPRLPQHPIREIDEDFEDIAASVIDYIQEGADRSDLRTFFFNMMSDNGWQNRDFQDLLLMVGTYIDWALAERKVRDMRQALTSGVEGVVQLAIGAVGDEFPDLLRGMNRREEDEITRAADTYHEMKRRMKEYERDIGRDDGRDRRREYDRSSNRDRDRERGRGNRRNEYNRDAVRGGRSGGPGDRFSNQRDDGDDRGRSRESERGDRYARADERSERNTGDRGRATPHTPRNVEEQSATQQSAEQTQPQQEQPQMSQAGETIIRAREHQKFWLPSSDHPHPIAINNQQEMFMAITQASDTPNNVQVTRTYAEKTATDMDYEKHSSMAFGRFTKDANRFIDHLDIQVKQREALVDLSEETLKRPVDDEGKFTMVEFNRRLDMDPAVRLIGSSFHDIFLQLNHARMVQQAANQAKTNDRDLKITFASAQSLLTKTVIVNNQEMVIIASIFGEKIHSASSVRNALKSSAKQLRWETLSFFDRRLTSEVTRFLRQQLSIMDLKITSFLDDYDDLLAHLESEFGPEFKSMLDENFGAEIKASFEQDETANLHTENTIGGAIDGAHHITYLHRAKIMYVDVASQCLNMDMLPGIASELLKENVPFFYEIAEHVLKHPGQATRFYISTSDRRVIEVSRSLVNTSAILARVVA